MVNFTGVPTTGPAPLTVDFTSVTQNITLIKDTWSFGDGWQQTQISDPTITHVYQSPGKYDVTLEAENLIGSLGYTMSKTDYIYVTHVPPVAGFTYIPHSGNSPVEVQFTSTTTGFEPELLWDFDDGETTTATNPTHTFTGASHPEPKYYLVNLTATNDGGSTSYSQTVEVLPPKPHADFIATSTTTGPVPLAVQFNDTSIGMGINSWSWQFGDGGTSGQRNPVHAYSSIGLYDVTLTASSLFGSNTTTRIGFVNVTNVTGPVVCPDPIICPEPTICPTPTQCPTPPTTNPVSVGIYKDGTWYLDMNGNGIWNGPVTDRLVTQFGQPGWEPVRGDWNGNGITEIGIYKDGVWYLDMNGDGMWGAGDAVYSFGSPTWNPVIGDWTGTGTIKIGIYKAGTWYLDLNGNGVWDGTSTDKYVTAFGLPGWTPVPGKWS
jgi:PKD repeat protein